MITLVRESKIEKSVCDYAKKELGCLVYKFVSPGKKGVPDRMFVFPNGTIAFIEFKAEGKKPTPLQRLEMDKLDSRLAYVNYFDNIFRAKAWLQNIFRDDQKKTR